MFDKANQHSTEHSSDHDFIIRNLELEINDISTHWQLLLHILENQELVEANLHQYMKNIC